jgi:uncharacterized phiE125 gp8 family phage protein
MTLRLITGPSIEPVTLAEVKRDARIDGTELDSDVELAITTARLDAEAQTGRVLITQTWELVLDKFPENEIQIGMLPVQSIESVKYYDGNGTLTTIDPVYYSLDADTLPGWVLPAYSYDWPTTQDIANAVLIRVVAGYGAGATDVPAPIRQWIRYRAASSPTLLTGLPESKHMDALIDQYRLHWI